MLFQSKYTLSLLLTILFFLGYASLDVHWSNLNPIQNMPDANIGILPGMFLYGLVKVGNTTVKGYELSMASHAPLNSSKDPQLRVAGIIREIDHRDNPRACDKLVYTNLNDSIALVERGTCNLYLKIANCQAKGAKAVLISESSYRVAEMIEDSKDPYFHLYPIIPSMVLTQKDYYWVSKRIYEEASVWTLSAGFDPSLACTLIVLFIRPIFMLCIVSLIIFINMLGRKARKRSSPRLVCSLPRRLWNNDSENFWNQQQCLVCLEDFSNSCEVMTLPCSHEYHVHCISQWLLRRRNVCPICCREVNSTETSPLLP